MTSEQRKHERRDAFVVVEFRPLKGTGQLSLGITTNVSEEGFSFESQHAELAPGQVMEFILKHPQGELSTTASGEVVWIRKSWYKYTIGIKLLELDKEKKERLREILSSSLHIPLEPVDEPASAIADSGHAEEKTAPAPSLENDFQHGEPIVEPLSSDVVQADTDVTPEESHEETVTADHAVSPLPIDVPDIHSSEPDSLPAAATRSDSSPARRPLMLPIVIASLIVFVIGLVTFDKIRNRTHRQDTDARAAGLDVQELYRSISRGESAHDSPPSSPSDPDDTAVPPLSLKVVQDEPPPVNEGAVEYPVQAPLEIIPDERIAFNEQPAAVSRLQTANKLVGKQDSLDGSAVTTSESVNDRILEDIPEVPVRKAEPVKPTPEDSIPTEQKPQREQTVTVVSPSVEAHAEPLPRKNAFRRTEALIIEERSAEAEKKPLSVNITRKGSNEQKSLTLPAPALENRPDRTSEDLTQPEAGLASSRGDTEDSDALPADSLEVATYEESFNSNANNWPSFDTDRASAVISGGAYYIENRTAAGKNLILHSHDFPFHEDFILEVSMRRVSGDKDSLCGFVFGAADDGNYYSFLTRSGGFFVVRETRNGTSRDLLTGKTTDLVMNGMPTEVLKLAGNKDHIRFYINDRSIGELSELILYGRKIGFIALGTARVAIHKTRTEIRK